MTTITIQEAQANLTALIHRLSPGEEVLITENNQPVARLLVSGQDAVLPSARGSRDWWTALQKITAGQQQRGFVGIVADIDRDDQSYEDRMSEIDSNTVSHKQGS